MNIEEAKQKYLNDVEFHNLVDMFYRIMFEHQITIMELKDALLFAGIKFEQEHLKPLYIKFNGEMELKDEEVK